MRAPAASPIPPTRRTTCRSGAFPTSDRCSCRSTACWSAWNCWTTATDLPSFRHPMNAAYVLGPERSGLSPAMLRALPPRGAHPDAVLRSTWRWSARWCCTTDWCSTAASPSARSAAAGGRCRSLSTSRHGAPRFRRNVPDWVADKTETYDPPALAASRRCAVSLRACVHRRPARPGFRRCPRPRRPKQRCPSRPEAAPCHAAKKLGRFDDWIAATHQEGGQTVCYAFTSRKHPRPLLPGRGEVVLTVTERPGGRDAVAISAGFDYPRKDAAVTMQVDTTGLDFYTAQRNAFARDGKRGGRRVPARAPRRWPARRARATARWWWTRSACGAFPPPTRRSARHVRRADGHAPLT